MVFDDLFTTVAYMKKSEVPPNWIKLVSKSERVTDEDYDLAKTWLVPDADSGDIAMQPLMQIVELLMFPATIQLQHNNLDIRHRILIFLDLMACKEYPLRIKSKVHFQIQSTTSCHRRRMKIQHLLSSILRHQVCGSHHG